MEGARNVPSSGMTEICIKTVLNFIGCMFGKSNQLEFEMKILKRSIALLVGIIMCFNMAGCNSDTGKENDKNKYKLTIMTTLFPYYDFARAVVGDVNDIHVELLLAPGQDAHSFEPTPDDIIKIDDADLFIYNGGSIENWVEKVVDSLGNKSQIQMRMMEHLEKMGFVKEEEHGGNHSESDLDNKSAHEEQIFAVEEHEHEEHEYVHEDKEMQEGNEHNHEEVDEHIWTSPVYSMILVQDICNKLCEMMPENKEIFQKNAGNYINQLKTIDRQFREIVEKSEHKEIIFADKFPLRYFADEYGLKYYAAFPGCSGDTEPSAKTVAFLIDKVKDKDVNGVFYLELSSQAMADVICDDTNVKKYQFNSCHNITQKQFDSGVTYLDLMRENVKALKAVLK